MSIRRACDVLKAERSSYHYKSRRGDQANLKKRIKEIAEVRVRYGYRRIHVLLVREGWPVNWKRVRRLYREMGLQLRSMSHSTASSERSACRHIGSRVWTMLGRNARLGVETTNEVRPHSAIGNKPPVTLTDRSSASGPP